MKTPEEIKLYWMERATKAEGKLADAIREIARLKSQVASNYCPHHYRDDMGR